MKPMLAAKTDGTNIKFPVLVSPKLDGIRCLIIDGVAMSRSLKPIPNKYVQKLFGKKTLNSLDGELIVGDPTDPTCFNRTSSGVMSVDGTPPVKFYIFDDFEIPNNRFETRLSGLFCAAGIPGIVRVHHHLSQSIADLNELECAFVKEGYEGIMIRDPNGAYKFGRSTVKEGGLLKMKRFSDAEAKILGFKQLMSNNNEATIDKLGNTVRSSHKAGKVGAGVLGAFTVKDVQTGVEFDIGTGFTATDRFDYWKIRQALVGKLVKYRYQPAGVKDKPRFPTFVGFRDERDM